MKNTSLDQNKGNLDTLIYSGAFPATNLNQAAVKSLYSADVSITTITAIDNSSILSNDINNFVNNDQVPVSAASAVLANNIPSKDLFVTVQLQAVITPKVKTGTSKNANDFSPVSSRSRS